MTSSDSCLKIEPSGAERLQQFINQFSLIERRHYIPLTDRKEDDASHTISVTLLAWYFYEKLSLNETLDLGKVLRYATVHDLVEAYAGDVPTHASAAARQQKVIDEENAMKRINSEFGHDFPGMTTAIVDYEKKADEEARFVWIVDKIQSYAQGYIDNWRPYHELPVTIDMFQETLAVQRTKCPEVLLPFFDEMMRVYVPDFIERYPK